MSCHASCTMAEKNVSEIQGQFLTCKICKQMLNRPKTLPCTHTFCRDCLVHLARKNGTEGKDGLFCIFCPVCAQVCDLPKKGVDGLHDNRLLKTLLKMVSTQKLQDCDACRESKENNAATYCCVKCEEFLCDECARAHKRTQITGSHMVVNVAAMLDIYRSSRNGERPLTIQARLLTKFSGKRKELRNPISICVNKADDVLVSNDNDTIAMFSLSGACKKVLQQSPFYVDEESRTSNKCIAVTSEGYIAVAMRKGYSAHTAHVGVLQTLASREASVCSLKTKTGSECQPHGIAVTDSNHVIVTDIGKHCVYIFDSDHKLVKQFGKWGSKGRRQFKYPYYVAACPASGDIVVSDYDNHCLKIFDINGKPKNVIGKLGRDNGQFVHPMGVCVDRYGNIFVADRDNHRVQMFSAKGRFLTTLIAGTCQEGEDIRPQDVALTAYGHLVVMLKGIEGVDLVEIHVYQYGSSASLINKGGHATANGQRAIGPKDVSARVGDGALTSGVAPDLISEADSGSSGTNSHVCTIL